MKDLMAAHWIETVMAVGARFTAQQQKQQYKQYQALQRAN